MMRDAESLGDIEKVGDSWHLRFVRHLEHPADKVWHAITDPEHLKAWFPSRVIGRIEPGAKLHFEDDHPGIDPFDGEVLRYEEPHLLELRWATDKIRFEIEITAAGCTLTFTDTIGEVGKASRDGAGWHVCLEALVVEIDGAQRATSTWAEIHPHYVDKFGPEASTIGPPAQQPEPGIRAR